VRASFIKALTTLAEQDSRILLLTGDLGYMAIEPFVNRFPDRFLNVGVAEQNMVGLATGLAESGFIPFVYSIVPFVTLRPYEFIRNGPIQHRLPVRIVGVGGGFEYGTNGLSHYGLEDVGVMRIQPGITVIAPADHQQAKAAILATWDLAGPIYYRLGKDDKAVIPGLNGRFELGKAELVGGGTELALLATGSVASEAVGAADILAKRGVACSVLIVSCLNPAPAEELARVLGQFPIALTVEAHYQVGGLGSLVAEVIAELNLDCRLVRCGVRTMPDGVTGSQRYLQHTYGLSREALVETALQTLSRTTECASSRAKS
jgi:transketolase